MQRPPSKRRKISDYDQKVQWEEEEHREVAEDWPSAFAHAVEPLEDAQLAQPAAKGIGGHQILLPRQDTAMSNAMTTATMAGSDAESAAMASMSTANEAATTAAAAPSEATNTEITNNEATATQSPEGLALSVLISASISLPISEIASVATGLPNSVVSGVMSDVSGVMSDVSGVVSGVSGLLAPSDAPSTSSNTSSAPSSSSPNVTSPASSTSSGNDTTSIISTPPMTNASSDNTTTTTLLPASTSPGFLTSSFSRNSTISASQTSSSDIPESSSSTESVLVFIATLSQGDVTTLSRSADPYTTVLDGSILTVSAAESTSMSRASRTTDTISSSIFSSLSDSSTSTELQTTSSTARTTESETSIASQYTSTSNAAPTSTGPASNSNSNNSSTPPAGTIAGGVVGGAAGLAVVVLIAMLALKWYRRQGLTRHQALPQGPGNSPDPNMASASGPGMAERAGLAPFAAVVPALFRHQNRTAESEETTQRGFTRVAGRKLPSAFSGGAITQAPSDAPINRDADADLSGTSFYRDSTGFYGGDSIAGSPPSPTGSFPLRSNSYEHMTISPGPRRIPRLHSGGPYNLAAGGSAGPSSPQAPPGLTRSDAPFLLDPNRNSRFSEGL